MILDTAWSPVSGNTFFATAGRDKLVKVWRLFKDLSQQKFEPTETISRRSAVTAIAFTCDQEEKLACLVVGEEDGLISFHVFDLQNGPSLKKSWDMDEFSMAKTVTRLQWRPKRQDKANQPHTQLAIAVADGSIQVLRVDWETAYFESSHRQTPKEISGQIGPLTQ